MASDRNVKRGSAAFVARCVVVFLFLQSAAIALRAQSVTHVPSATRVVGEGTAGFNNDFGTATNVELSGPTYSIFDAQGNLYLSDTGNNCVRKVDTSGNISTVAGKVQLNSSDTCNVGPLPLPTAAQGLVAPAGLAIDAAGNLYIADSGHNCVRKLPAGETGTARLTAVVDTCLSLAATSIVPSPSGIALDGAGGIYVSTSNTVPSAASVVKATSQLSACTIAGAASVTLPACAGVTGTVVLNTPSGLVFDPLGNLLIADTGNSCVRELNLPAGTFSTPAGLCANDASGSASLAVSTPFALAFDQEGRLYITSRDASQVFQSIPGTSLRSVGGLPSGATGPYNNLQDGTAAVTIPFASPRGVAVDGQGNVFASDTGNSLVRELSFGNQFGRTPVGTRSGSVNLFFQINSPVNLTTSVGQDYNALHSCAGAYTPAPAITDPPTICFVTVQFAPTRPGIRQSPLILNDSTAAAQTSFRLEGIGTGASVLFTPGEINTIAFNLVAPAGVATDSSGNQFYVQAGSGPGQGSLFEISSHIGSPQVQIPAGGGLDVPTALALDAAGNIFIADAGVGKILRFDINGHLSTVASGLTSPTALAVDVFGNIFVAEAGTAHDILEIQPGGERRVVAGQGSDSIPNGVAATSARLVNPTALAIDVNGVLYVGDAGAFRVYSIDTARQIHVAAGNGTPTDSVPGSALGTGLKSITGLAVDAAADLFIVDAGTNRVLTAYASPLANGAIAVLAGTGTAGFTGDGGPANLGTLNAPSAFALDASGNMFVVDAGNKAVRLISYPPPTLNFGSVVVGQTSPPQTVTLWDVGTDDLTQSQTAVFSDPTHFSTDPGTTQCGQTDIAGAVCNIGYVFTPTAAQAYTSTVTFTNNSYFTSQVITLVGNSVPLLVPTLTDPPVTFVYGQTASITATVKGTGPAPTGTVTFTYQGTDLCAPQSVPPSGITTCVLTNPQYPAVGTYADLAVYSGDANYATASITGTLTITPAPLTVTANDATRPYGVPNPPLTATISGLVAGNTATASATTTATISSPAGTYPIVPTITPTGGTLLSNYTVTLVNGTLTITKASTALTISVNNATRVYGTPNPIFTGTVTGQLNGDTITVAYSTTATITSPVGTYPITATLTATSATNYSATVVTGTLTITQASTTTTLQASASPISSGTSETFTAQVASPVGLVPPGSVTFTEGATVLGTVALSATGSASLTTTTLPLGTDTIVASYGGTTNFSASSSAGVSVVVTAPVGSFTIAATPNEQVIRGGGSATYQVTVTSVGGFAGPVALTCSGLPADASCSFATPTGTLAAGSTFQTTMTASATTADARLDMALPGMGGGRGDLSPLIASAVFPLELSSIAALFGFRRRKQTQWGGNQTEATGPKPGSSLRTFWLVAAGVALLGLAGCGCPTTAFHSYPITITATSVNGGPAPATTSVNLSVSK